MSRSGYSDEGDASDWAMWRGQVASALRGKRGQQFLRDLVAALEALPQKRLIKDSFERGDEGVCSLGAVRRYRELSAEGLEQAIMNEDYDTIGDRFEIAHQLAQEVMFENDERRDASPEARYERMLRWAKSHIRVQPEELQSPNG